VVTCNVFGFFCIKLSDCDYIIFSSNGLYVFRHQLPTKADFIQQCMYHVRRMSADHQTDCVSDSVQGQTTQDIECYSLPTVTAAVPSMSNYSGSNQCKSTDRCSGSNAVETLEKSESSVGQQDCKDECTSVTLIAYCLAQYISTLNVEHQHNVQSRLLSDTVSWISKLFR